MLDPAALYIFDLYLKGNVMAEPLTLEIFSDYV